MSILPEVLAAFMVTKFCATLNCISGKIFLIDALTKPYLSSSVSFYMLFLPKIRNTIFTVQVNIVTSIPSLPVSFLIVIFASWHTKSLFLFLVIHDDVDGLTILLCKFLNNLKKEENISRTENCHLTLRLYHGKCGFVTFFSPRVGNEDEGSATSRVKWAITTMYRSLSGET